MNLLLASADEKWAQPGALDWEDGGGDSSGTPVQIIRSRKEPGQALAALRGEDVNLAPGSHHVLLAETRSGSSLSKQASRGGGFLSPGNCPLFLSFCP